MRTTRLGLILLCFISIEALYKNNKLEKDINVYLGHPIKDSIRVNKPENVQVLALGSSRLNATWDSPSEGSTPDYYHLIWNGEDFNADDIALDTFNVISGLKPCSTYRVSVYSVKAEAESDEAKGTGITDKAAPQEPKNLNLISNSSTEIQVQWESPPSECIIDQYSLDWEWQSLWGEGEGGDGEYNTTSLSYTIKDLIPYSNITVCVLGVTRPYNGPQACDSTTTLEEVPGPPKDLKCAVREDTSADISWAPPLDINGVLGNWMIKWTGEDSQSDDALTPAARSYTIDDLTKSTTYKVILQASTGAGAGGIANCTFTTATAGISRLDTAALLVLLVGVLLFNH